jgi:hypothetical protein
MLSGLWKAEQFEERLERLRPLQRIAFAAECAARSVWLFHSWARRKHRRYGPELQAICEELRTAVRQGGSDFHPLERHVPAFDHLVQEEYTRGADQAALAVLYAVQCALGGGSTRHALDAAEKAYSTRWVAVTTPEDDTVVALDEIDRREAASPELRKELAFQLELLTKLEATR